MIISGAHGGPVHDFSTPVRDSIGTGGFIASFLPIPICTTTLPGKKKVLWKIKWKIYAGGLG